MTEDAFSDIASAIMRLRAAFLRHNMQAPISIELGSLRDKDLFLHLMPRDLVLAQPRMGETRADAEHVCNIMGMEVRLPAEWRKHPNGRSYIV